MTALSVDKRMPRGDGPWPTANVPSGYSFILLQIGTPHRGVHPLDLSIGVHPTAGHEPQSRDVHSLNSKFSGVDP